MTTTINHPLLGRVHGKQRPGVVQFLGLKYGFLRDRLSPSEIYDGPRGGGDIDGTKIGPTVAFPAQALDMEFGFIQKALPKADLQSSDIDGLILNITVPNVESSSIPTVGKLPVFVYVHGGGFAVGSANWPQYDHARIVKLSVDNGTPVIGIGINYRVGVPGFLTSEELRNAGYAANNGLYDQITALQWIKKNIDGFGGDFDNVTLVGESAGAASGLFLLQSKEPLFKRLVNMSGTSLLVKPLPGELTETMYLAVLQALYLDTLAPDNRVKALLETPIEEILAKVPPTVLLSPSIDGDLIPEAITFAGLGSGEQNKLLPGFQWCESLLIGDCQFDGMIFAYMIEHRKSAIAKTFIDSVTRTLFSKPGASESLLYTYSITPTTPDTEAMISILQFATDIAFYAPTLAFSEAWPGAKYIYRFNQGNPWEGTFQGHATHVLDVALLFMNFADHLDESCQRTGKVFATEVLKFIAGKEPWSSGLLRGERVIGSRNDGVVDGRNADAIGRRQVIFKLGTEIGLDELSLAWFNFLRGQ